MKILLFSMSFLCYFNGLMSQVPFNTPCPKLAVVHDFDTQKYLGLWYEIEKYPAVFQKFGTCVTATYSARQDQSIDVLNRSFNTSSKSFDTAKGVARLVDPQLGAKLSVSFPGSPFQRPIPKEGNYWVLSTDYVNYSIVWSCESFNGQQFQFLWYLSREKFPTSQGIDFVHNLMDSLGLQRQFLQKTDQTNCPDTKSNLQRPVAYRLLGK